MLSKNETDKNKIDKNKNLHLNSLGLFDIYKHLIKSQV